MTVSRVTIPMDVDDVTTLTKEAEKKGGTFSAYCQSVLADYFNDDPETNSKPSVTKPATKKRKRRKR